MNDSMHLLSTGNKIIITEDIDDSVIKPQSLGFVSYVTGVDRIHKNVVYVQAVMNRIGKQGKPRLKLADICFPILTTKDGVGHDLKTLSEKRKGFVNVNSIPAERNKLTSNDEDFVAWAVANILFLYQLRKRRADQLKNSPFKKKEIWPDGVDNPVNKLLAVKAISSKQLDVDFNKIVRDYGSQHQRDCLVRELRIIGAALKKENMWYLDTLAIIERQASTPV